MIKRILVATDASRAANRAVDLAADMATKYGASLEILYVVRHMQLPPELRKMAQVENVAQREADVMRFVAQKVLGDAEVRAKKKGAKDVRTSMNLGKTAIGVAVSLKQMAYPKALRCSFTDSCLHYAGFVCRCPFRRGLHA